MHIWDGTFPAYETSRIKQVYFCTDYNPQGILDYALWNFLRNFKIGPSFENYLSQTKRELEEARQNGAITSPRVATMFAIWQTHNFSLSRELPVQGQIRRASRECIKQLAKSGRAREYWKIGLYRRLGYSYYLGTNKRPYISGRGTFRGVPYKYFCDLLDVIQTHHGELGLSANTKFAAKQFSNFDKNGIL